MNWVNVPTRVLVSDDQDRLIAIIDDTEESENIEEIIEQSRNDGPSEQSPDMGHPDEEEEEEEMNQEEEEDSDYDDDEEEEEEETNEEEEDDSDYDDDKQKKGKQKANICDVCHREFRSPNSVPRHKNSNHNASVCYFPGCEYIEPDPTTDEGVTKHLIEAHHLPAVARGHNPLQCSWPGCRQVFTRVHGTKTHFKMHNRWMWKDSKKRQRQ